MIKILSNRINPILLVCCIAACAPSQYPVRTTQDEGIVSARARNELAVNNPEGLVRVGEGFEKSGNLRSALNLYGQAMSAAPGLTKAQIAYARVTAKLGNSDRALAMLDAVLMENAGNISALHEKADILIGQGLYRAALDLLSPVSAASSPEQLFRTAKLHLLLNEVEEGRALLAAAIDKTPHNSRYIENLAFSYALADDFKTAIALVQQALDKPEGKESGRYALALIYALSGQINQALEFHLGILNQSEMANQRLFYRALKYLTNAEKAEAVFYRRLPANIYDRMK